MVHGLAGSAVVGNTAWAMLYLLLFGAGARFPRLAHRLRVASGILSLVFGRALAYQIGVLDGLFGANPTGTPR